MASTISRPKNKCQIWVTNDARLPGIAKKKCQTLVKNGATLLGIAIGIGQTQPKFHTTPVDGTKAKKPLKGQAPFEITVKDVRVL